MSTNVLNISVNISKNVRRFLLDNYKNPNINIISLQGGARAGKTYNTLLFFVLVALQSKERMLFSVVRQTLAALKSSAERDFKEILLNLNIYSDKIHNKTDRIYKVGNWEFEFFGCDQSERVQGRKRDFLFVNEATELSYDVWNQLMLRTSGLTIIDFNPKYQFHFLWEHVYTRSDFVYKIFTYKDNAFLPKKLVDEIERLRGADNNLWRVYGLGLKGISGESIYTHYNITNTLPNLKNKTRLFGLDFGFNHPTALIEAIENEDKFYLIERLYQDKLSIEELIKKLKNIIPKKHLIYADSARPEIIKQLTKEGFNMLKAKKDVFEGINFVKSKQIYVYENSENLISEFKGYSWKKNKQNIVLDEPVKLKDDAMDASRYVIYSHFNTATCSRSLF